MPLSSVHVFERSDAAATAQVRVPADLFLWLLRLVLANHEAADTVAQDLRRRLEA